MVNPNLKHGKGKKEKKSQEPGYTCEICLGTEKNKPVVACDRCDKWHHFACVGITAIGREESWICDICDPKVDPPTFPAKHQTSPSQQSTPTVVKSTPPLNNPPTSPSQQSTPTVVHQENSIFPSRKTTQPSNNPENVISETTRTSVSHQNLTCNESQASHRSGSKIADSFSSKMSSESRRRIQLDLIEEERKLQEQRDNRYLEQKYKILMSHQDGEKRTDISHSSRTTNVRSWVESQHREKQTSQQGIYPTTDNIPSTSAQNFINRVNKINFDANITPSKLDTAAKSYQQKTEIQNCPASTPMVRYICDICHMSGEEKLFVKCCLCIRKAHHTCMDIMFIDKEFNWICDQCKDPRFEAKRFDEKSLKRFTTAIPTQATPIVSETINVSTPVCEGCDKDFEEVKQPFLTCYICGKLFHFNCIKTSKINDKFVWICTKCKGPDFTSTNEPLNTKNVEFPKWFANQDQTIPLSNTLPKSIPMFQQLPTENVIQPSPDKIHTLTSAQIASRHVVTKDLPIFVGRPDKWSMFYSRFKNSTELCGFSDSENLDRLQKCLKGNAYDAVESRLLTAESVPGIMATLKMLYGRPELIINALMNRIRSEPPPKADKLNTLVDYALAVKNVCATLEQADLKYHLSNPALLQELVEKLPTNTKIEWAKHKANIKDITLSSLGDFLYDLAAVISTVTEPTPPNESKFEKKNKKDSKADEDWGNSKSQNWKRDSEKLNVHRDSQSKGGTVLFAHSTENASGSSCVICQKGCAKLEVCTKFISQDVDQRWKDIYNHKLCRKCLKKHSRSCNSTKNCGVNGCIFKHHALLHDDKKHTKASINTNPNSTEKKTHNAHSTFDRNVLLRIVPINIYFNDRKIQTFAYLDDGSDVTLVSEKIVKEMGLQGVKKPLCLFWTSDIHRDEKGSQLVEMEISGRDENSPRFSLSGVRTVENLGLPSQSLIKDELVEKFQYLRETALMEYEDAIPEVLIGSDNASLNAQQRLVEGEINQPIASQCRLGWTINGRIDNKYPNKVIVNPHVKLCPYYSQADEDLHQQVKDHFTLENFGVMVKNSLNLCSKEDERALELLNKFTKRIDGRYETSLLWRYDSFEMPNSYPMALRRLICLEKHKSNIIKSINDIIIDYVNKGYVSKLSSNQIREVNPKIWYLPIFVVTYPKKPDKIRMVFDAAAKVKDTSLNSFLLKGPDQLGSLVNILRRFREKAVAATGDIKEMYHQVVVREQDRQAQRFLWRNGETRDPDQYVMNVMTFGATCSPSTAQFVKNLNANEHQKEFPRAVKTIIQNHYVDDMLECEHNEDKMIQLINDVKHIHSRAGFEIRNFSSNSKKVMKKFGVNKGSAGECINLDTSLGTERVLGMWWNMEYDYFTFSLKYTNIKEAILKGEKMPTKREVLQTLMSVFDPVGLLSHYLVHLKILLQDIWRSGMTWDEEISSEVMKTTWVKWIELLSKVEELRLPRLYSPKLSPSAPKSIELHTFVDASEQAYSAVTFIRVEDEAGVDCSLIGSKTRVAPIKYLSVPRLELQGGILGTRLLSSIGEAQTFKVNRRIIWTKVEPIRVGDVVLIIKETNIRNTYPRAKVLETIVGSNGQVRRARVQQGDKNKTILWRSAQNLARLDIRKEESTVGLVANPMSIQTGRSVVDGSTGRDITPNTDNSDYDGTLS